MSHQIEEHDTQQGTFIAWHGLTELRPEWEKISIKEALASSFFASWEYEEATPYMIIDGEKIPLPSRQLTVSDVKGLCIGETYNPDSFKFLTNASWMKVIEESVEGLEKAHLASCGTFGNRAKQFASVRLNADYKAGGREFQSFLNFGNGNDKSDALWSSITSLCTVCANTYAPNREASGTAMRVKKTKFSEVRIENMSQVVNDLLSKQKEFIREFDALALVKCSEEEARAFFAAFLGKKGEPLSTKGFNTLERLVGLFEAGAGNAGENLADVFSAATDYWTHEAASAQNTPEAKAKNFVSSEFGSGAKAKRMIYDRLTDETARSHSFAVGKSIVDATKAKQDT